MSKSVTVIQGSVWTRQSVTRLRNIATGNDIAPNEPKHTHGHHHHEHHGETDDVAGVGPDDEWDAILQGRTFIRRIRNS
jgi:hypothetical protein